MAEDLLEAGFSQVPEAPPPARQLGSDAFGVDIVQNAAAAINSGAVAYAASCTDGLQLRDAMLDIFQAIELFLKIKVASFGGGESAHRLDNRNALEALAAGGVRLRDDEKQMIGSLRALRNRLQHSGASYGFRDTRVLLERAFVFVDRFALDEFKWWLGDIAEQPAWDALLRLEPIQTNALKLAHARVADFASDRLNAVESCPHCEHKTVARERGRAGFCLYCQRIPVKREVG
jgi:hypothetical protein